MATEPGQCYEVPRKPACSARRQYLAEGRGALKGLVNSLNVVDTTCGRQDR